MSFEVDHLDEAMAEGGSVLPTGRLRRVENPGELRDLQQGGIEPWASNDRDLYLRLISTEISGRRIFASG